MCSYYIWCRYTLLVVSIFSVKLCFSNLVFSRIFSFFSEKLFSFCVCVRASDEPSVCCMVLDIYLLGTWQIEGVFCWWPWRAKNRCVLAAILFSDNVQNAVRNPCVLGLCYKYKAILLNFTIPKNSLTYSCAACHIPPVRA